MLYPAESVLMEPDLPGPPPPAPAPPTGTDTCEGPAAKRKSVVEPNKFSCMCRGHSGAGSAHLDKLARKFRRRRSKWPSWRTRWGLTDLQDQHVFAY